MPNTLAHIGVQGLLGRSLGRDRFEADFGWIVLGVILPDVPWILHRIVAGSPMDLDPFALRAYAVSQSSLVGTLLLAGAIACLSAHPRRVFGLLGAHSLLHLLLDASQTKWGNGVLLFHPIVNVPWNAGLYWPESASSIAMSLLGLVVVGGRLRARGPAERPIAWPAAGFLRGAAVVLGFSYLVFPLATLPALVAADAHGIATLADPARHVGAPVALDRASYRVAGDVGELRVHGGRWLRCASGCPPTPGQLSVRGRIVGPDAIAVEQVHVHRVGWRDGASYLGLGLGGLYWLRWLARPDRRDRAPDEA